MTTRERVLNIFADKLGLDTTDIEDHSTMDDLGADSLDQVELLMELEKEFQISIPDDAAEDCDHFVDYVKLVEERIPTK